MNIAGLVGNLTLALPRQARVVIIGAMLAASVGCTAASRAYSPHSTTTIRIANESWSVSAVYLSAGSRLRRVATIDPLSNDVARVNFRDLHNGEVVFLIRQIGDRAEFRTERVRVLPGQTVDLAIAATLAMSRLAIR